MITVTGGTKQQRSLVKEAAVYYLDVLLGRQEAAWVDVDVSLVKGLFEKEGCKADVDCLTEDDDDDTVLNFALQIDSAMNMAAILLALAHECVHIKQYAKQELKETGNWNISIFRGETYDLKKVKYFDAPWEIEAYGREDGLLYQFVTAKKLTRARWYTRDPDYL